MTPDYAKFLSLAVPRDPPAMPLGIGEVVKRLWKWMRGMRCQ